MPEQHFPSKRPDKKCEQIDCNTCNNQRFASFGKVFQKKFSIDIPEEKIEKKRDDEKGNRDFQIFFWKTFLLSDCENCGCLRLKLDIKRSVAGNRVAFSVRTWENVDKIRSAVEIRLHDSAFKRSP